MTEGNEGEVEVSEARDEVMMKSRVRVARFVKQFQESIR